MPMLCIIEHGPSKYFHNLKRVFKNHQKTINGIYMQEKW